ncbi:MAG: hypothetical protein ACHQF0_13660 [Chitinophagales bacterium]
MKKFLIAILAILYLASTVGATIHFHYCMGKLYDWELVNAKNNPCTNCEMAKERHHQKHKCCNDEYRTFKNGDQKLTETTIKIHSFGPAIVSPVELQAINISPIHELSSFSIVPLRSKVPLHILNCVFLI